MDLRYAGAAVVVLSLVAGWRINQDRREVPPVEPTPVAAPSNAALHGSGEREETLRFAPHSMEVAGQARQLLTRPDYSYRDDCSGYVSSAYSAAGIPMDGTVNELFELAVERGAVHHHPIPRIGDLAFFDNTHDRNSNGKWDDHNTHIAVVVDVEPDGTAVLAHKGSKRALLRMNLLRPMTQKDEADERINGHLRRYGSSDTWSLYLASQLWTAFATIDPERPWLGPSAKADR